MSFILTMFFSIFIVYTAVQNQVNRALETSSRITALLATHGNSITTACPTSQLYLMVSSLPSREQCHSKLYHHHHPSTYRINSKLDKRWLHSRRASTLCQSHQEKKAEPSSVRTLSFHKSAIMQQNPCCCAQTINNNKKIKEKSTDACHTCIIRHRH